MFKSEKYGFCKIFAVFVGMLFITSLLIGRDALADRKGKPQTGRDQPRLSTHRIPLPPLPPVPPIPPIPSLPGGHKRVQVGPHEYYYHHRDGSFFRRGPSGFISVRAPFGAIVFNIPIGARAVMCGGDTYYVHNDVYYRRSGTRYIVVEPPRETVIIREATPVVPAEPNVGEKVVVATPLLNIRSGPGMNFPVVREVAEGELLTVHGYAPEWLYVQLASGEFGWTMVKFTAPLTPPANG